METKGINLETQPEQTQAAGVPDTVAGRGSPGNLGVLLGNRKAVLGASILIFFVVVALLAPVIAPGDPSSIVGLTYRPPSAEHWLGTTSQGQDTFAQMVWGARSTLAVGFSAGLIATVIGVVVGMIAGYAGGRVDDVLSLFINVLLVIPGLPLLIILAAFLPPSSVTIVLILSLTFWASSARVFRAQTMSLRERDFVSAAIVSGESRVRIIFRGVMPNMVSIIAASFLGAVVYAIASAAGLEFLGLGDTSTVSWGTILYWAQNNMDLLNGAWWTFVPPGLAIALVAFALAMLNYAVDEISNPRLRTAKEPVTGGSGKGRKAAASRATPVVRENAI